LALSEQQYLVCDTAFRSTKRQVMLEILGGARPLWPPGYAYSGKVPCILEPVEKSGMSGWHRSLFRRSELPLFRTPVPYAWIWTDC